MNWIPVSERLPAQEDYDERQLVALWLTHAGLAIGWYNPEGDRGFNWQIKGHFCCDEQVTHWCRIVPPGAIESHNHEDLLKIARFRERCEKLERAICSLASLAASNEDIGEAANRVAEKALKEENA